MGSLQGLKENYTHIFHPLRIRQNRLRIGNLAFSGGVEKTQEELRQLFPRPITLNTLQIESCLREYEEWLESDECKEKAREMQEYLEIHESEERALKAYE